jgi:hypothetical protein
LRGGLNAAAFAFAQGQNSREIDGQPAAGGRSGRLTAPPVSWAMTVAPTIHATASAAVSTSDRRVHMFVTSRSERRIPNHEEHEESKILPFVTVVSFVVHNVFVSFVVIQGARL